VNQFEFPLPTVDFRDARDQSVLNHSGSFPWLHRRSGRPANIPNGLVVSSDLKICGLLAEKLLLNGIAPTVATSIAESRDPVTAERLSIVLCEDLLPDGKYSEILRLSQRAMNSVPVIVVSRTGGWEEYFAALEMGVYDFLALPPIPGELQRVIRNCFMERSSVPNFQNSLS
jgi:DNA-binding NtrC family response regulator